MSERQEQRAPMNAVAKTPKAATQWTPPPAPKADSLKVCQVTDPLNVKLTFLELTDQTCPSYEERDRFQPLMEALGCQEDGLGNYYRQIGESDTMFTCHLDDVSRVRQNVTVRGTGEGLIASDGTTILGADCKAGMSVMLFMMARGTPGLYVFFVAEEVGRIGSEEAARRGSLPTQAITKVVSFDRKGYESVITHQSGDRTCSDLFALSLAGALSLTGHFGQDWLPDDTGSYTDSMSFSGQIPECTNLSVGYHNAHLKTESVDLDFVESLAVACSEIDWAALPVERDPQQADSPLLSALLRAGRTGEVWTLAEAVEEEPYLVAEILTDLMYRAQDLTFGLAAQAVEREQRLMAQYRDQARAARAAREAAQQLPDSLFGEA